MDHRPTNETSLRRWRDAVFFASGFAGLIYESIWTHYLKLFLGHAAYAQTLVLAIFMGGMAIGAAAAAHVTERIRSPLKTYALIEAAIGALAIAFHPVYTGVTGGFYEVTLAHPVGGIAFATAKWGLAALLILPQSILLGATFPLFAAAATRDPDTGEAKGRPIAMLYFANSLGGAVGVLASGFLLIPSIGLHGTIATAGVLNLGIAAFVLGWGTLRRPVAPASSAAPAAGDVPLHTQAKAKRAAGKRRDRVRATARAGNEARSSRTPVPAGARTLGTVTDVPSMLLVTTSLLTGAASFIYEIGWIRMLSLVLGSATHSFELMLSSFILGLALGGLWIRKRIDASANPGALLAAIQIAMGALALATLPLHGLSFDLFGYFVREVPRTDGGYALFNLARYGIASLIMFPAAFCAGTTLPLVTRILYAQKGQGEKAIGVVYSANTVGAILGLVFAVNVALPVFGLEYVVASGALIDVPLGAVLLVAFGGRRRLVPAAAAVIVCGAATVAVAATFDPEKLSSGVYRSGIVTVPSRIVEIAHGKTATVAVNSDGEITVIRTNGKPDASAHVKPPLYTSDQVTMTLTGAIPLLLHPAPRLVANVGLGSGITGEAILSDPRVRELDTIEIEPRMVELARHFGALNRRVYEDPRSAIRIEDAKSFFAANGKRYDVIVSEPSNPWVSGVAGLFSVEFYRHVSRYLNEGGLFAQWLQTYEMDADRAVSVLKAVAEAFDDYMIFALVQGDVLIVAKPKGKLVVPLDAYARLAPDTRLLLRELDVANLSDVTFRIVGNKAMFAPFLDSRPVAANSDFAPYLDSNADRDRFMRREWTALHSLSMYPISETLGGRPPLATPSALSITSHFGLDPPWLPARLVKEMLLGPATGPDSLPVPDNLPDNLARQGRQIVDLCSSPPQNDRAGADAILGAVVLPYLSPAEGGGVLSALRRAACLDDSTPMRATWPALLASAADRNAKEFGALADELLESAATAPDLKARYALGMAMLGRIAAGDRARAKALWDRYATRALGSAGLDLALEILRAHAQTQEPGLARMRQ